MHPISIRRLAPLAALLLLSATGLASAQMALAPGDRAPSLEGVTFPVEAYYVSDWGAAKLTIVNFWASWCVPCRGEMAVLEEIFQEHRDSGLAVIGSFELWEPKENVQKFLDDVPVSYPIIRPHALVDHYWTGVALKPTTFLVAADGRILRKYIGAEAHQLDGLRADVVAALEGKPLPSQVMPSEIKIDEQIEQRRKEEGGR